MADKTKSTVAAGVTPAGKKFAFRISGEMEAESLKAAYHKLADHFSQLAVGNEPAPLTDGICRVTPVEGG